jgi:uncharacterized protein (TIGR00156 family)
MKNYMKVFLTGLSLFICGNLFGQYTGPGTSDKFSTVKAVQDNASRLDKSDELVKVKGFIIRQINKNTFEFMDNTGKILVEIDKKALPAMPFDDKTELILIGEVDSDLFEPTEIEVKEVHFVNLIKPAN